MSQATGPFNEAVETVLLADGPLVAYLGGNYVLSGVLAQDVDAYDFVILGSDDTLPWNRFNGLTPGRPRLGAIVGLQLDAWSRIRRADGTQVLGKSRVLAIAAHLARVLDFASLALPSYGVGVGDGQVNITSSGRDPGGTLMHCAMRYEATVTQVPS